MPIALPGKPILITGASSGIGRATAIECANAGMFVLVMARREDRLRDLVDAINAADARGGPRERSGSPAGGPSGGAASPTAAFAPPRPRAVFITGDVSNPADCERAVAACLQTFGSIYAVFANAGFGVEIPVHDMTDAQMRDIFETNLFGSLNIIRPALPHMLKAGAGHVLWCSSCLAKLPMPLYGAYCATKAAQHHLSRAMNMELRRFGVRSSSVHPVGTRTEFFETASGRTPDRQTLASKAPSWSMQSPQRVARAVVRYLRSPKPEVWTSLGARIGFPLLSLFPALTDRVFAKAANKSENGRRS